MNRLGLKKRALPESLWEGPRFGGVSVYPHAHTSKSGVVSQDLGMIVALNARESLGQRIFGVSPVQLQRDSQSPLIVLVRFVLKLILCQKI